MILRRWMGLGSAALLAGAFIPLPDYVGWRAVLTIDWHEDGARSTSRALTWIPACLGVLGITLVALVRRPQAARALAVFGIAASAAYTLFGLIADRPELRLLSQFIVGASMCAAGNRAARRFPERRLPPALAWIGGAQVVLGFVFWTEWVFNRSLIHAVAYDLLGYDRWVSWFALALLGYGVLAVSILPRPHPARVRRAVQSWAGSLLLVSFPGALLHHGSNFTHDVALLLKFWLLGTGHTVLLSAALAGWMEEP